MKVGKRDLIVIVLAGVLLAFLLLRTGSEKARPLPADGQHGRFLEQLAAGQSRVVVEKGCLSCHTQNVRPLSKGHPPKEQCLICHSK
jgi:cbb3-type cytochrome oxidase cytochrome c subunit